MTGKNVIFWFGVFVVSMLVMMRPAQAETISASITLPSLQVSGYQIGSTYYDLAAVNLCTRAIAASGIPNLQYNAVVGGAPDGSAQCWAKLSTSTVGYVFATMYPTKVCVSNNTLPSTSCPEVYYCPPNQNWSLSGSNCTRPDCVAPETRNVDTGVCEAPVCPHTYLGIATSRGYKLSSTIHNAYVACDTHGCEVSIAPVATVFGVSLLHQSATPNACVGVTAPALTVTITEEAAPTSPDKTKFDDVVAAAAAVDAARTEQARQDAYIAKVVADGLKAKIAADTAAAEAAVAAQKQAVADVKRKAGEVAANPTTNNINNYNTAVTNYNGTVSTVNNVLTQLYNDYATESANNNNAQSSATDAAAIKAQIDALKAAIAASGQPYNPADIAVKTAGDTALDDQLAATIAALASAAAELAKAAAAASQAAADIAAAGKALADTAAAIKRLLEGLPLCITNPADPSCKPVVPFCVEHPADPTCLPPPNTPFCVDHPDDPTCKPPEQVDCTITPNAPGCQAMSGTPEVRTLAMSGVYAAGTLNEGKTFDDVFAGFKDRALGAPMVSAASNFFTVSATAGQCPTWSTEVPMFGTFVFDFYCKPFFQNLLPWMRGVILIIFSVIAFQIAVL